MKLTWCHNRLAIGSVPDANADLSAWAEDGITHVVNCRRDPNYQRTLEVLRGVVVLWNPVDDDGEPKPPEWFQKSIDFALNALASPRHKVCVCCCEGNNRSPSTALAILMAQGLSYEQAANMVQKARPGCQMRYSMDVEVAIKALGY